MRPSIEEAICQTENTENVEIIEVPFPGDRRVLLRVKEMPEFAFFIWADKFYVSHSDIVFRMPNDGQSKHYVVLCAFCSSEIYGLDPAVWESRLHEMQPKFREAVLETCRKYGITTVFMCDAGMWTHHYGDVEGLQIVEASEHKKAMQELYGRKHIREALRFIDYDHSRRMGD